MWHLPCAAVPLVFIVLVLLHIPLCYWFVGMMKKRRIKKEKVCSPLCVPPANSLHLRSPVNPEVRRAFVSHGAPVLGTQIRLREVA